MTDVDIPRPRPLSEPTTATFLILRMKLSKIVGHIVHHFQKLDEPAQYSDVEKLQRELEGFIEALPPHYRMYQPDKSRDQSGSPVARRANLSALLAARAPLHALDRDSGHHHHPTCEQTRRPQLTPATMAAAETLLQPLRGVTDILL